MAKEHNQKVPVKETGKKIILISKNHEKALQAEEERFERSWYWNTDYQN